MHRGLPTTVTSGDAPVPAFNVLADTQAHDLYQAVASALLITGDPSALARV
ncbi:hypothetical protein BW21_6209 (plasmid) [Burkholderia humptydooensis]|nr:hypothetical protein BW21_6209 [Burkholderia sp. 2002721687]